MTAERDAWFQGSRVRLDLNAQVAVQLRDALDRIIRSDPSRGAALARSDMRLPDGHPLRLSVRLTDAGTAREVDPVHGTSERVAYVDVSGDFDTHVAARRVIDAATRPYREVPRSEQAATELDAARVDRAQPDGTTIAVRNGMTGRVTATRDRDVTVQLDAAHHAPGGPTRVTLPAGYVGAHVEYGYARTVDTAQGATVDHSLFAPSPVATAERAYVALSRGRLSNRVYATRDSAWIDALGRRRGHALAVDQQPALDCSPRHVMRPRALARDRDRQPALDVGL